MFKAARASLLALLLAVPFGVLAVAAGPAVPAWAHAELIGSTPAAGSVLGAAPARATLTFSDPINATYARAAVQGPGGTVGETPTATGPVVTVAVPDQGPGGYAVLYRVVSADGHPVSGELRFTVAGTPTASATAALSGRPLGSAGVANPTSPGAAAPLPTVSQAPAASASDRPSGGAPTWLVAGVIAAVVAAVVAAMLLALRPRRRFELPTGMPR